jgi:hypothetical protein
MSATVIMRALLGARSQVTSIVPRERIFIGNVPQGTPLPAVSLRDVGGGEIETVARRRPNSTIQARVQVTVYAGTYEKQEELLLACKLGDGVHTGIVNGYHCNSVLPRGVGPALASGDITSGKIYERSRDFMVTFKEAN